MGIRFQYYTLLLLTVGLTACGHFSASPADVGSTAASSTSTPGIGSVTLPPQGGIGAIQFPKLFTDYTARPSWQVSGVDFNAGPQVTPSLDPANIHMTGVTVDATTHVVTVSANDITLNGYDFSLNGGWQVSLVGADNTTIKNCNWKVGVNLLAPIVADSASHDLYVGYSVIDGADLLATPDDALITMKGVGLTVEYSWLLNSYGDVVDGGGTIDIQYNLIDDCGQSVASDLLNLGSQSGSVKTVYNTIYQPAATGAGGLQGFILAGHSLSSADVGNNTAVALAGANMGDFTSVSPGSTGTATIHDNWVDPTGISVFAAAGSSGKDSLFLSNMNLATDTAFPTNP